MSKDKKELSVVEPSSLVESGNVNFNTLYDTAIDLISDQALVASESGELSMADLRLSKAKTENFMDAIGSMLEISHKVEMLSADPKKFKRGRELDLLNGLFSQYEEGYAFLKSSMTICTDQLERIQQKAEDDELTQEDIDQMVSLRSLMSDSMKMLKSLAAGSVDLIKAERETGGRSVGGGGGPAITMQSFMESFEGGKGGGKGKKGADKPRKLSDEEISGARENQGGK